jgi:hypothetical protein
MAAANAVDLFSLLELIKPLNVFNEPGGATRATYDKAIRDSAFLLNFTQVDEKTPGTVSYTDRPDANLRYFPSMAALQLYFEEDADLNPDAVYTELPPAPPNETPAARSARLAEAVKTLAEGTYANDIQLTPDFPWTEKIEFQVKYTYVYEALRHRVLVARQARNQVVLTRTVEKTALASLLADPPTNSEIVKLQQACTDAFATAQLAQIQPAVASVVAFVSLTLYDKFIELANEQAQ